MPRLARWLPLARRWHRRVLHPVVDIVLPADCFACHRALGPVHLAGACLPCWASLHRIRPPFCPSCAAPLPAGTDLLGPAGGRCAGCVLRAPEPGAVRAVHAYDSEARRFLLRAKLGGRTALLEVMGRQLAAVLAASDFANGCTAVVPVPSHPWVRLRRGFAPALEVARPVARRLGLPLRENLVARRLTRGAPAKRLGAAARRRAAAGAFRASHSARAETLLLVDDVITTGATARACARALVGAGAREVRLGVWARTPRRARRL